MTSAKHLRTTNNAEKNRLQAKNASTKEEDMFLVGNKDILSSPNVRAAPPSVNRPIPVPSVFVDERGEIHNLNVGEKRINLLYTRRGVMRSGDIHENVQHDFIFAGRVEVWRLTSTNKEGTEKTIYGPKQYLRIEPYIPHIFHFLEDTVMAEWWEEPQEFYAWFYEPYRSLVQDSFTPKQPGHFQLLIAKDDDSGGKGGMQYSKKRHNQIGIVALHLAGALTLGIGLGYYMGKRRS